MAADIEQAETAPEAVKLLTGHLTIWQTPTGALLAFQADDNAAPLVNQEMAPMLVGPLVQMLSGQPLDLSSLPGFGPMAKQMAKVFGNGRG